MQTLIFLFHVLSHVFVSPVLFLVLLQNHQPVGHVALEGNEVYIFLEVIDGGMGETLVFLVGISLEVYAVGIWTLILIWVLKDV